MNYKEKLEEYKNYLSTLKNDYQDYSEIWNKLKNDFTNKDQILNEKGYQRRYGINTTVKNQKIRFYININTKISSLILRLSSIFSKIFSTTLSYLVFGRKDVVNNYRINYPIDIEKKLFTRYPEYRKSYKKVFNKLKWFYSINSFKSFSFYHRLTEFVNLNEFQNQTILEIGSGLCNFCMILSSQLDSFTYICLDIPEMIPNGYHSINTKYKLNDIEVFLPQEYELFLKSSSKKKILFILPDQLKDLELKFKMLVNHESFAEMNINTVNNYLKIVKEKLDLNSYVFLVNRMARQNKPKTPLNYFSYTFFDNYDLNDFQIITKQIDSYRDLFKGRELRENIFYIGKKIN